MTDISDILTEAERQRRSDRAARTSSGSVSVAASVGDYTVDTPPTGINGGNVVVLDASGRIPASLIPAGAGGGGTGGSYRFVQATPAQVWTIPHGLGGKPDVEVVNQAGQRIATTVLNPDDNTTIIRFGRPYAGAALLTI